MLNSWNEDSEICEVVLEGDIEDISCQKGALVIYDTPGTNNSQDILHHDITIDFIKNNQLDLVIYLINAEYISTNDTEILLKEILSILENKNTKIIFGLNKIDCFDEEGGEYVKNAVKVLVEQLNSYGVAEPVVFPFSTNAARLFKLVIKGKELTKRERRMFRKLYEYFLNFNASDYVVNAKTSNSSEYYPMLKKDKEIVLDDIKYSYNKIVKVLGNTGILNIEKWLAQKIL